MGCPSPINNLEERAYETPVREVLQGSRGNNTAELWIPFSPPFPSWKPDGFQSFAVVEICVCVRMCVCAHTCLEMRNDVKERKKSIRHISYGFRQICNENTIFIFLTYFVSCFSCIAHCNSHQNETFCQRQCAKGFNPYMCNKQPPEIPECRNSGGNCTGTFGHFSPSEGHISHTGVAYCLKEKWLLHISSSPFGM